MRMDYAVRKDVDTLVEIECVAHMKFDADLEVDVVDEYVWTEHDFLTFSQQEDDRHQVFALFDGEPLPFGFIAYIIREDTRVFAIEKMESLKDEYEADRLEFMLRWLMCKANGWKVVCLVEETSETKISILSSLGFIGEPRRRAFSKNGRDGILFHYEKNSSTGD